MPNGFRGSPAAWNRLAAPLLALDPVLEAFASDHGMTLTRNSRQWPERSLIWGDSTRRLIQIFLSDEETVTWNLWICASEDRPDGRYWKQRYLARDVPASRLMDDLESLLPEALRLVGSWESSDLAPAGA